jgi:hypothetical protein
MTHRPKVWGTLLIALIMVVSACSFPSLVTEPAETEAVPEPDISEPQPTEEPVPDNGQPPPGPPPGELPDELICNPIEPGTLVFVICNVRDAFRSRNTAVLPGFLSEPFLFGYYQSEGRETDIPGAIAEFESRLPTDPSLLEFIIDREEFPDVGGVPPENYMPFEDNLALVVYSPGWDGTTDMLLYFTRDASGHFKLSGALVSLIGFD